VRACGWALRRPGDAHTGRHTELLRRRPAQRSALRELIAVDRASVWRAPALRRGGAVLVVLPGLVAAVLHVPWTSLLVLPGLVAAGAGCCSASTPSRWTPPGRLAGLHAVGPGAAAAQQARRAHRDGPRRRRHRGAGRRGGRSRRTHARPGGRLVGGVVACTAVVVALSMSASLKRPHRAELRGPRDAVAPPGALAAASVRLAVPCSLVGMVVATSSELGVVWLPLLVAVPPVLLAGLSLVRSARRFADPVKRSRVVAAVAAG
jgi:hypothetical protein